jgi:hypothetical protein
MRLVIVVAKRAYRCSGIVFSCLRFFYLSAAWFLYLAPDFHIKYSRSSARALPNSTIAVVQSLVAVINLLLWNSSCIPISYT